MIHSRVFDRYLAYIHRTGLHTELEAMLRPTSSGRPRALRTDILLAGMLATFNEHQTLTLTKLHATLTTDLDRNYQRRLGIRTHDGTPVTLRQVRYLWNTITDLFEHTEGRRPTLDTDERSQRVEHLQDFLDRLLGAATAHIGTTGKYAIDGTAIESAARGKRRPRPAPAAVDPAVAADAEAGVGELGDDDRLGRSADCDARWGYRTRTYDNKTNLMFGFQMVAFTRIGAIGEDQPLLTERIAVVPGNSPGITETIATLDRVQATTRATEVIADRGFTYKTVETWARPLRDRGIKQVLDLHALDHGARVHPDHGYCPSIPQTLIDATKDFRAKTIDLDTYRERIKSREAHRARFKGTNNSGTERYGCPASGSHPAVICALKPKSEENKFIGGPTLGIRLKDRVTPDPSTQTGGVWPKPCRQESVSIDIRTRDDEDAPVAAARFAQDLVFGTDDHTNTYNALRQSQEGLHGFAKDDAYEALGTPGKRRIKGRAAQAVFSAFLLAAAGIRKVRVFLRNAVTDENGDLYVARRKRKGEHATTHLPPGTTGTRGDPEYDEDSDATEQGAA